MPKIIKLLIAFSFAFSFSFMPWKLRAAPLRTCEAPPRALSVFKEKQMNTAPFFEVVGSGGRGALLFFCETEQIPRSLSVCHYIFNSALREINIE